MTHYATFAELRLRLGDLYKSLYVALDGSEMVEEAQADLDAAQAEIDGMIGGRYAVPVTVNAAMPLLKNWTITLAEEIAWSRSARSDAPENLKSRLVRVRLLLDQIQKGDILLGGVPASIESSGIFLVKKEVPVFTRDQMKGF